MEKVSQSWASSSVIWLLQTDNKTCREAEENGGPSNANATSKMKGQSFAGCDDDLHTFTPTSLTFADTFEEMNTCYYFYYYYYKLPEKITKNYEKN